MLQRTEYLQLCLDGLELIVCLISQQLSQDLSRLRTMVSIS